MLDFCETTFVLDGSKVITRKPEKLQNSTFENHTKNVTGNRAYNITQTMVVNLHKQHEK
jgi:hypothetical protein